MPESDDELLTPEEVAALWKVNKRWVYDQYEAGRLSGVKLSRKALRFRRSALREFIETRDQAAPDPNQTAR